MPTTQLQYLTDELNKLREQKLYQKLRVLETEQLPVSRFDGREVINLSSNNYLGLTTHPKLRARALEAIEKWGVGSGAVRTIAGTMAIHMELEEKIARFKHVEASVVFQSGFTANAGTVQAILGREDIIVSDQLNHASIIDGCRLSRAEIKVFPHKDIEACENILREIEGRKCRKLLVTDGVFSMDGDIAPLPQLVELAEKYGCIMMIDDAHASGVLGRNGRGTVDHFNLHGRVDIQVGTLSKAIGALGGYICSTRDTIEFLYHRARPFLFSTSHPPSVAATCLAAFEVLEEEPQLIDRLWANTKFFKEGSEEARVQHRRERNAHHARHRGRRRSGSRVLAPAFCRRRVCPEPRLPHRPGRQSPHPHHRHRHAHPGRIDSRARDSGKRWKEVEDYLVRSVDKHPTHPRRGLGEGRTARPYAKNSRRALERRMICASSPTPIVGPGLAPAFCDRAYAGGPPEAGQAPALQNRCGLSRIRRSKALRGLRRGNYVHVFQRLVAGVDDVVPRCGRNVDEHRRLNGAPGLALEAGLAPAAQDHQRLLVLAGGVPADRSSRLQPHEAAAHPGGLRRPLKQRAISLRAFKRQRLRLWGVHLG